MNLTAFNQIKWKLTLVILTTSAVVLVLGCIAVLIYDSVTSWRHLFAHVDTIAGIAAANNSAALAFSSTDDAQETLHPLIARRDIDLACLYTREGKPFVVFTTNGVTLDSVSQLAGLEEGQFFDGSRLVLKRKVLFGDEHIGSIIIGANLKQQSARSRAFLAIALSALAGLIGVALLLATRLQRLVSDPIAELAQTANHVTAHKDYRVRAHSTSNDEIGTLVAAFNQMLSEIERQNHSLVEGEKRLKLALSASQMGTWEWNLRLDTVSWSSELRELFGSQSEEADLSSYSKRIHPDDAERFLEALRHSAEHQVPFASEYRVQSREGKSVWLAHHGQTLHDSSGRPSALAGIVQDISQRKQAETERQRLVARLLHAEEDERRRIARELHDTTAQHLAVLKINFARICNANAKVPDARMVAESRQLLDQALLEIRTLTYVLHPPLLEEFGLVGALGDFAAGVSRRNGIQVELQSKDYQGRLLPTIELTLFRVVQECVTNAIRHSGTRKILIRLARDTHEARVEVQDFGRGFPDRTGLLRNTGVGIASMQERLALVGGALDVESEGKGVTVLASVPITAEIETSPSTENSP